MDRRIYGLENEYGVTCTLRGQRRLSPDEVARYLFRRVVSWGRSSNVFLANGARLYLDVGSHPEYASPECDSHPRPGGPRQGGGVDPRAARRVRRGPTGRGGHPGRHLPVPQQHRLRGQQLRVPRELPDQPRRRPEPLHRGPDPVPREPPDLRRCGQGPADRPWRAVLDRTARRAHLGGCLLGDHALPADHQHPRRAPRRLRPLPAPARDRGRLEHERVRHLPQGGRLLADPADARGPDGGAARHDAGEPDPGDPGDQPRHHLHPAGPPGQRPRGLRARDPVRVPQPGASLRREPRPVAPGEAGPRHVGARDEPAWSATRSRWAARSTG